MEQASSCVDTVALVDNMAVLFAECSAVEIDACLHVMAVGVSGVLRLGK